MIRLTRTRDAWGKPDFNSVFKQDLEQLDIKELPLQRIVAAGTPVDAVVIAATEDGNGRIRAKAGVYYPTMIGATNCEDEAGSLDEQNEYAELQFDIDKATGETAVSLLDQPMDVGCD